MSKQFNGFIQKIESMIKEIKSIKKKITYRFKLEY